LDQDAAETRIRKKTRSNMMNAQTMLKGAFLTFCLTGVLVLPAAAAGTGQATTGQGSAIDQGLKDHL
jgi:hypothetical protein